MRSRETIGVVRIGQWFQGPTNSGQGGWTSQRLQAVIGEPVTVAIRRPIPLEQDLAVIATDDGQWHLIEPHEVLRPVLIASRWDPDYATTTTVPLDIAAEAQARFPLFDNHPVPVCFSCGLQPDSMHVHSGELSDGRWASSWQVPAWSVGDDGQVDEGALWAAIDCAQAWYAGNAGGRRPCVTAQLAVTVYQPLVANANYSLVAWQGTYSPEWDGRKRGAGGAVFAEDGTCVAQSSSFWVAT